MLLAAAKPKALGQHVQPVRHIRFSVDGTRRCLLSCLAVHQPATVALLWLDNFVNLGNP